MRWNDDSPRYPAQSTIPIPAKINTVVFEIAAATGTGIKVERALALFEAGADAVVVDTAHGHSHGVLHTVHQIREAAGPEAQIIAGNVATGAAADALIAAGLPSKLE